MKKTKLTKQISCTALAFGMALGLCACGSNAPNGYTAETKEGLMFDEPELSSYYNYCPSILVEGDNAYVWYCSNETQGIGGDDHIAFRKGINIGGAWYWGEKQFVLGPKEGTYYSGNICDPDVIKGEFSYKGETYSYLMSVLGCKTIDNTSNMFGFFVAKSPEGPWIDVPEVSPMYDFYEEYPDYVYQEGVNDFIWGWGQASLVSMDKHGKVMLFYTGKSGTGQKLELWDFSNLENPSRIDEMEVTNKGVTQLDKVTQDTICNAQFMYDDKNDRFFMICDVHPFSEFEVPTNLPYSSRVYYLDNPNSKDLGYVFGDKRVAWKPLVELNQDETSFPRNHNCCFFRNEYGYMISSDQLDVSYTMCPTGADWKVLFSYRIYHIAYKLEEFRTNG